MAVYAWFGSRYAQVDGVDGWYLSCLSIFDCTCRFGINGVVKYAER